MQLKLVSHINGDGDLLEAWFKYYLRLGVTSFHLVVHGSRDENARLFAIKESYPVLIEEMYEGPFDIDEKKRRLNSLLAHMRGEWVIFADSDEFVEFPYRRIPLTIRMLELSKANVLYAPMVQHLTLDGSLDTPVVVKDPFRIFPLCSVDLYKKMGSQASIKKYPLFYCTGGTELFDGGNHTPPLGAPTALSSLQGATHHFKFRSNVLRRLDNRINSSHLWRHESVQYQKYLEHNSYHLPTEDSFTYSRGALFRRRLLRKFTLATSIRFLRRAIGGTRAATDVRSRW